MTQSRKPRKPRPTRRPVPGGSSRRRLPTLFIGILLLIAAFVFVRTGEIPTTLLNLALGEATLPVPPTLQVQVDGGEAESGAERSLPPEAPPETPAGTPSASELADEGGTVLAQATATAATGASVTPTPQQTRGPTVTPTPRPRASNLPIIAYEDLPPEAWETIRLIDAGGPFPFRQDDTTFQNRERRLPIKPMGYYREYTVVTPGAQDRAARRIVAGGEGELYYTEDHYGSFREVVR